jgi:hypothetical protein
MGDLEVNRKAVENSVRRQTNRKRRRASRVDAAEKRSSDCSIVYKENKGAPL